MEEMVTISLERYEALRDAARNYEEVKPQLTEAVRLHLNEIKVLKDALMEQKYTLWDEKISDATPEKCINPTSVYFGFDSETVREFKCIGIHNEDLIEFLKRKYEERDRKYE